MDLKELKKRIEDIEIGYDYEDNYCKLYNTCIDYENNTQKFDFDYLFEDFISYDIAEEMAKNEIEQGGLERLYYFLGNANLNNNMFKINGYGNLEDITINDFRYLKEEILKTIKDMED